LNGNGAASGKRTNGRNGGTNGESRGNGYSAPSNGRVNGGNGGNGYSAPTNGGNGRSAPTNGGNGYSSPANGGNGYSAPANGGSNGLSSAYGAPSAEEELAELAASLPGGGVPGEDFPVLSEVPDTGFQCGDQAFSGYYADDAEEARCQVFHICQLRESGKVQQDSFLCPNGTIFNQQYLVCDWWFNFDCSQAQGFYSVNEQIGKVENNGASGAQSLNNGYAAPTNGQNGNGLANGNGQNGGYGAL
jgi:hypothetical protein